MTRTSLPLSPEMARRFERRLRRTQTVLPLPLERRRRLPLVHRLRKLIGL